MADRFKGELDPQIADLLSSADEDGSDSSSEIGELLNEEIQEEVSKTDQNNNQVKFQRLTVIEEKPKPFFADKDFYKKVISGEGESTKRVHDLLTKFLNAQDPQDKSMFRARLIPAFWDLASSIATKSGSKLPLCKQLLLRFGILSPSLITPEQQNMISRIIFENKTGEPIHYADEWMLKIATGVVNPSATDELKRSASRDDGQKIMEKVDQTKSQRDAELLLLKNKAGERTLFENQLAETVKIIRSHTPRIEFDNMESEYTQDQKRAMTSIAEIVRKLSVIDRDIARSFQVLQNLGQSLDVLNKKVDSGQASSAAIDTGILSAEFNTLRQMSKLCVGRKGNHFPILLKHYIRTNIRDQGTRENIINEIAQIENLDSGLFLRTYKNQTTRIVPNIIILPNYGERGICWEPFERKGRATSRGRIAIPLFPKNLRIAVITACADLRWQVAKEKALHYWMEEGITGKYYQRFEALKLKGDVKEYFINDYVLWITRESEGTQKLDREVRGIFWRLMPFPQELKEKLKNRGFVYNELYKKDQNRARSDGY